MGVKQRGSARPEHSGAPSGFESLLANSVREDETALCLDCLVTFNIRNRTCPKCDGDQFWLPVKWRRQTPALPGVPSRASFPPRGPRTGRPALAARVTGSREGSADAYTRQRLIQVREDVGGVLDSHGDAAEAGG
jgi:hypothetical protein